MIHNHVLFFLGKGIPSCTVPTTGFSNNFTDETIEEAFPPTAQDAAELEAVEKFVELMAGLDLLERREEATRLVHAGLQKRWEARRQLLGRPRVAKNLVHRKIHGSPRVEMDDLVVFSKSDKLLEYRMRSKEHVRMEKPHYQVKAIRKQAVKMPIQQPRKHY